MVTQREETSQDALRQSDADLQDDFKIVDETTPEQLEIEAELDAEAGQVIEPETEQSEFGNASPEPEAPEVQSQPQAEAPVEPEPVVEQQPLARTYSVDEVAKIQSAYDTRLREQQDRERRLQEQLDARNLEAEVEAALRRQEAQLAQSVGEEEASRIARDSQNVASVRSAYQSAQRAARLERELAERDMRAEEQAKQIYARQLMDQNGLQTADYGLLLNTFSPDGMRELASRLANQTLNQRKQQEERRRRVPPETPGTQLTNGHSDGAASETPAQALARINAKQAVDWTDADWEFMRTGVVK